MTSTPPPLRNVDEKWTGLQKQSKACNLFIYFLHKLPLARLPYKFIRTTIISSVIIVYQIQICGWLVYVYLQALNSQTVACYAQHLIMGM